MNMKQKMIDAMCAGKPKHVSHGVTRMMLDSALAVLADPANWTKEIESVAVSRILPFLYSSPFELISEKEMLSEWRREHPKDLFGLTFPTIINHIREQEA